MSIYFLALVFTTLLQTAVPALLSLGCLRWWQRSRHWSFLVLFLCGTIWVCSTATAAFIDFGKTPEQVATDYSARFMRWHQTLVYFHLAILFVGLVGALGFLSSIRLNTPSERSVPKA